MRTIKKKRDFADILRAGRLKAYDNFAVRYRLGACEDAAFGFSLPRKLGSSVVRNRTRRRLKAAVREREEGFPAGRYVFIARRQILRAAFRDIEEDLMKFFGEIRREIA